MLAILGDVLIVLGTAVILIGLVGLLRLPGFVLRLLAGAKTDTVGFVTVVLGLCLHAGWTWFTAKALLIVVLVIVANPVVASAIAAGHARDAARTADGADGGP